MSYLAMNDEVSDEMPVMEPEVTDWSILLGWRGSHAYGLAEEGSDKDLISVCVPPIRYYMGLEEMGRQGTVEYRRGEWDIVCYEARKFCRMLSKGSVDALVALWLPQEKYLSLTGAGEMLIENRDLFMSRQLYFVAHGFLLENTKKYWATKDAIPGTYKMKDAMHTIRTVDMVITALGTGKIEVEGSDYWKNILLDIKHGYGWTLDKVYEATLRQRVELEAAYIKSPLPESAEISRTNNVCYAVISRAWDERKM